MSDMDQRPETFDDLTEYERKPAVLARISIDESGAPKGVLAAADTLFTALRAAYGADLIVQTNGGDITASRPQTDTEKQKVLQKAQDAWDREHGEVVAADTRSSLQVGDTHVLGKVSPTCEAIHHVPCSLAYIHQGKHIKVVDGVVTEITER